MILLSKDCVRKKNFKVNKEFHMMVSKRENAKTTKNIGLFYKERCLDLIYHI